MQRYFPNTKVSKTKVSKTKVSKKKKNVKEEINEEKEKLIELYQRTKIKLIAEGYPQIEYDYSTIQLFDDLYELKFTENQIRRIIFTWKFKKNKKYDLHNVLKDPFSFLNFEEQLISFKKAEEIRNLREIDINIDTHTNAWICNYFLKEEQSFYILKYKVESKYIETFTAIYGNKVTIKYLRPLLTELKKNNKIYYTTEYLINFEKQLGDDILDLYYDEDEEDEYEDEDEIEEYIDLWQNREGKQLTTEQHTCIKNICKQKDISLDIITGYPGTGKSTILDIIISILVDIKDINENNIFNLAPTGLAMKNLMNKCGSYINKKHGMTIHKFLMYMYNLKEDIQNKKNVIEINDEYITKEEKHKEGGVVLTREKYIYIPKIINIDESSMMNIFTLRQIINICKEYNCRLILLGDCNQLPPIGIGNPFSDLINSEYFHINKLNIIKRQNGSLSDNIKLIHSQKITSNNFDDKTMIFEKTNDFSEENINKLYSKYNCGNSCILVSQQTGKNTKFGWNTVNEYLQQFVNPDGIPIISNFKYKSFSYGDIVIRTENDYSDDVIHVNGDVGVIVQDKLNSDKLYIKYYDNTEEHISINKLYNTFELFYASTVHKMQGCEKDTVFIIIHPEHHWMWSTCSTRLNLIYTAISRAKTKCVIIGDYNLFLKSQEKMKDYEKPLTLFMKKFINYE